MKSVAIALSVSGVLGDFFSSERLQEHGRFSDECRTRMSEYRDRPDFVSDLKQDRDDTFDCLSTDFTTIFEDVTTSRDDKDYERSRRDPCSKGVDKLEEFCEKEDGTLCYFSAAARADLAGIVTVLEASVTAADCIPKICSSGDLGEFHAVVDAELEVELDIADVLELNAEAQIYCVAKSAERRYRRNQRGRGRQTTIKLISEIDIDIDIGKRGVKFDEDVEFKFRCNNCPRRWEVDVRVPKDRETDSDSPRRSEHISNYIASELNADEGFLNSSCSANYDIVDQSLNIACPEDVVDIEVQEIFGNTTGEWVDLIDFVSASDGFKFEGEEFNFDTTGADDEVSITPVRRTGEAPAPTGGTGGTTGAAVAFAPMMASVAAAAFALAAAQL